MFFACLLILSLILCSFNSKALKTNLNLPNILFQNKMDSIQDNLKPEVKVETEEEKIDIENHFHPAISSWPADKVSLLILIHFINKACF